MVVWNYACCSVRLALKLCASNPTITNTITCHSRVEDGRGGCALKSPLRFPSPLIKPDVLISRIRLSDRGHRTTHGGRPLCARIRCETASSPNTSLKENREVPRLLTLCRLRRKFPGLAARGPGARCLRCTETRWGGSRQRRPMPGM
jgi:hypothetical protein